MATKHFSCLCVVLMFIGIFSTAHAKSVFALSNHSNSNIRVYDTVGDQIDFQIQSSDMSGGAIDLAACFEEDVIFASFDGSNKIELMNSKTLESIKTESVSAEMAGLAYSQTYNWLFSAERYGSGIHIYEYDPGTQSFAGETILYLDNVSGIYGICLDDVDMRFYVCESESTVKYYNLQVQNNEPNLVYGDEIAIKLSGQDKIAVGATVYNDGAGTKYLYTTGYNHEAGGQQHNYIIRTSLTDPNETNGRVGVDLDASAVDVDVDLDTGYLYATIYDNSLHVYDSLNWTTDPDDCQYTDIDTVNYSGPAGVIVGSQYKWPHRLWIEKEQIYPEDPNDCVEPGDLVTHEIAFHPGQADEDNVYVRDILPDECEFISADPNTGTYDKENHIYEWYVGNISGWDPNVPGDPNYYYEITMQVSYAAEPAGTITNIAQVESDKAFSEDDEITCVECWSWPGSDPNIIYVDSTRIFERTYYPLVDMVVLQNLNTGTSWDDAYSDLNDALVRAGTGCGNEIWVASGLYNPGSDESDSFEIPDGVEVYGGFNGTETARSQRDWKKYTTVLSGYIDETHNNLTLVEMRDDTLLDGVTVEEGFYYGIHGDGDDFAIENCKIKNNVQRGVYCKDGNLLIQWCEVEGNGWEGIYHRDSGYSLTVSNSKIHGNQWDGIATYFSSSTILNSLIYQNGFDSIYDYYGLYLYAPYSSPVIRNNTIVHNTNEGLQFTGSNEPSVSNCILWYNNWEEGDKSQMAGLDFEDISYCCITDPNDPNAFTPQIDATTHNITYKPDFVYDSEPYGYYHIKYESECRNRGDNTYVGSESDMDYEPRIAENTVDIGADEVACTDTWNENDITFDGIINLNDFRLLSVSWLSHDPNDPGITTDPNYIGEPNYVDPNVILNWNPVCNLDDTGNSEYAIDLADLDIFWEDWLWRACWHSNYVEYGLMMGTGGGESMMMSMPVTTSALTSSAVESQFIEPKSVEEQILDLEDCIEFLEKIWMEDTGIQKEIDPDAWKKFMESVYNSLDVLKSENVQIE